MDRQTGDYLYPKEQEPMFCSMGGAFTKYEHIFSHRPQEFQYYVRHGHVPVKREEFKQEFYDLLKDMYLLMEKHYNKLMRGDCDKNKKESYLNYDAKQLPEESQKSQLKYLYKRLGSLFGRTQISKISMYIIKPPGRGTSLFHLTSDSMSKFSEGRNIFQIMLTFPDFNKYNVDDKGEEEEEDDTQTTSQPKRQKLE